MKYLSTIALLLAPALSLKLKQYGTTSQPTYTTVEESEPYVVAPTPYEPPVEEETTYDEQPEVED